MATLGDINVRIGVITKNMEKGLGRAQRKLDRFGRVAGKIGNTLSQNLTLPILGLGAAAVKTAGDFERYENGLTSIMGSSEAAKKEIELLRDAAKAPGLDLTQAIKGSVRLQAVEVSAEMARKALANFGNAIALAGGTSADLDGVTLALTQIISKGKISAEEINQLAERVPQVRKAIETAFGTSDSEALQKLGISAEEFVEKVTNELGKLPQATGGISNSINNAGQAITQFLVTLGNDINTTFNLKDKIDGFGATLNSLADRFSSLDKGTKKTILSIGGLLAALGPAIKVFAFFRTGIGNVIIQLKRANLLFTQVSAGVKLLEGGIKAADLNPKVFKGLNKYLAVTIARFKDLNTVTKATTIGAVIAVVATAAVVFNNWANSMSNAQKVAATLNDVNTKAKQSIVEERIELEKLAAIIKSETSSRKEKREAVKRLNEISPTLLGNLDAEKNSYEEINGQIKEYIKFIGQRAKLEAANQKLVEIDKKLLDQQLIRNEAREKEGGIMQKINDLALKGGGIYALGAGLDRQKNINAVTKGYEEQREALTKLIAELEREITVKKKKKKPTGDDPGDDPKQIAADLAEELKIRREFLDNRNKLYQERAEGLLKGEKEGLREILGLSNGINTEALQNFNAGLRETSELIEPASEKAIEMAEGLRDLATAAEYVGNAMYQAAAQGASSFKELGKAALKAAADVVRAKIMEGVTAYMANVLSSSGPLGLFLAPAAGAAAGAVFNSVLKKLKIPAFADGVTNFSGGMALVGERGPELVRLPRGSDVIPNEVAFGGMGGNMNITISGTLVGQGDNLVAVIDNARQRRNRLGL